MVLFYLIDRTEKITTRNRNCHLPIQVGRESRRALLLSHGFHPGEPNMDNLHDHFTKQEPVEGIRNIIVSPEDWNLKRRNFEGKENLNEIIPNIAGTRGQRLLARYCLEAQKYDLAIQFHGTSLNDGDAAIYGPDASPLVKQTANYLGLQRAIVRTRGPGSALPNALEIELGANSPMLDFTGLHEKMTSLANGEAQLPQQATIDEYVFMGDIRAETAIKYGLERSYEPFQPLNDHDSDQLHRLFGSSGLKLAAYLWDGPTYDQRGFRGEVLAHFPLPYPLHDHKEVMV